MGPKKFLFLPFLGGGSSNRRRSSRHHSGNELPGQTEETQNADDHVLERELTKHESAADFATKTEEDIVQDYNAPIHWWIISTLFPLIAGKLISLDQRYPGYCRLS